MSSEQKKSLFVQGSILALAGIITKIIGFVYRIPMANILGDQGNGIYSVAFGIYNIALTLSSYSLPQAVSKLVAEKIALKEYKNKMRIFSHALVFAVIAGAAAFALLWFGADFLEQLYARQGLARPLRVLAPTAFIVAVLGVFRGFYQGHGSMTPTAVSQIMEQIVNAVVSIAAAYTLSMMYSGSDDVHSWAAAGGTMGTLFGALTALLFFIGLTLMQRKNIRRGLKGGSAVTDADSVIYKAIFLTVIPIILSQTIYQIGNTIDDLMFSNIMASKGLSDAVVGSVQGVFNTQYIQLVNLPVAVATAMAASTLPSISAAYITGKIDEANARINSIVKFNMVIAIPSAAGLAVLGLPIVSVLFPRLTEYRSMAAMLMMTGSSAVVFYALSTITTSILQGSSHMRVPVIHSAISLVIHIVLIFALLEFTDLGVYGLIIGNVTFPFIVCALNMRSIVHVTGHRWDWVKTFVRPGIASAVMGVLSWVIYALLHVMLGGNVWIPLLAAVFAAVVIYGFLILKMHCFTKKELLQLPLGGRIAKLARM
ncbi:MAG: polysaccharide biosynthesis protein [Eubacteriales bacterium]|nr:polysaccharide biosynthesis protein [Eubacteriales bacterium]